jgi:hypothetical protein
MQRLSSRHLFFHLIILALLLAGCGGDDSPTAPPQEQALASTTAGSGGGLLEHEGFALAVPAGALDEDAQLRLYEEADPPELPATAAAPILRVEGIPAGVGQDFPLRLAHSATGADSLYALVGQPSYIPSLQQTVTSWTMVDVTDSLGWAILDLPVAGPAPDKSGTTTPMTVTIVRGVAETLTSDNKFKIFWSPAMATNQQVSDLKANMEEAIALYDFMGFAQEGFSDWPVKTIIQPLNYFGHWAPNPRKLGGHLAFSTRYIDDDVEMRLTAGHEMLHFCQYFYDPRTVWARGWLEDPKAWLDEATAVYIEDYFSADPSYCSEARGGREVTLLDGLLVPRSGLDLGEHGYGLSSLIRFLFEAEPTGDDFILATYQAIKTGTHAAAALQASTSVDLTDRWMEMLEDLVEGDIYSDVTWSIIAAQPVRQLMSISSAADSTGTVSWDMPDLSGRIGYVNLNAYEYEQNQRLVFWCDEASEYGLSVYGVQAGTMTFLSHAYGKVTLSNLPNLNETFDQVMILVSNQRFQAPDYNGSTRVVLQGRLRESEAERFYTHGKIRIQYDADWSNTSSTIFNQEMNFVEVPGAFSGTSFSATWDSTDSQGVHYWGHLTATLDPADLHVTSWSARNQASWEEGSRDFQASGGELPVVDLNAPSLESRIEGAETCNSIGSMSAAYYDAEGQPTRQLDGYDCSTGSYVKVFLYDRR